jgi:hypothetical protein
MKNLLLTSPTNGGRSVSIARSQTKATELSILTKPMQPPFLHIKSHIVYLPEEAFKALKLILSNCLVMAGKSETCNAIKEIGLSQK